MCNGDFANAPDLKSVRGTLFWDLGSSTQEKYAVIEDLAMANASDCDCKFAILGPNVRSFCGNDWLVAMGQG